jgi:hypothetical protein
MGIRVVSPRMPRSRPSGATRGTRVRPRLRGSASEASELLGSLSTERVEMGATGADFSLGVRPAVARPVLRRRLAGEARHLHTKQVPRARGRSPANPRLMKTVQLTSHRGMEARKVPQPWDGLLFFDLETDVHLRFLTGDCSWWAVTGDSGLTFPALVEFS